MEHGSNAAPAADACDIVVVGGGLVGASLALALAPRWRVRVVEARPAPQVAPGALSQGPWDERCIAVNDGSRRIFEDLGLWPALRGQAQAIRATQISERGRFGVARFTAAEAGLDALGWNIPVRVLGLAAWQALQAAKVKISSATQVLNVQPEREATVVELATPAGTTRIRARLVVAADGAHSTVREKLGVGAEVRRYGQHAIVTAVRIARPHGGVAYERFTREGPLAVLPKAADACSLVQTVPDARCEALMALDDAAYLIQAQAVFGGRLGRFTALGRRVPHALERVVSASVIAPRAAFVGNAAQSLHPVAAQGFNLGLRDAGNLAALLAQATDPGAGALLERFMAIRQADRAAASDFTDLLARVFANRVPGLAQTRHWGLVGAQLVPAVHRRLLHQHLGHLGLPAGE
ncbi:MAG: 2-octaprenyl-6-methoxyphenyl hydroxylase [Nevskiaceae bacterium]|nr:MAG: 2-octaprenyl-6-methoxyphenyl hydroxylase [Nevskiaceae bacterium]TBR74164.1 MAG: 2-octaprenyl-6-methoxyphenyl hydroxylase [Nevskiaceae bacterium]